MRRLLVADDDAGMRAALEARFSRRGWLVDLAANGTEALEKFRSGLHSLVITDVRMPGRDGFELMREVRNCGVPTAVILLTAYGCVPDAVEAMRNGACDYGKIGEWIQRLGFASELEVTKALALQWGCPVAASFDSAGHYSCGEIPLPILEAFQMLPLNYVLSTNTLYLAFGERVDHAALYAIEKILNCRTLPCVAGRESIATQLEAMRQICRPADVEFGPIADLNEMGRIAASYVNRLNPAQVRVSRIGSFIWLRLVLDFNSDAAILRDAATQVKKAQRQRRPETRVLATNLIFSLPKPQRTIPLPRPFRDLYPVNPQPNM